MVTAEEKTLLAERMVTGNLYKLRHLTAMLTPEELAEMINSSKDIDFIKTFSVLEPEKALKTFENLEFEYQEKLLNSFTIEQLSDTLNKISPDDRTGLFEKLPEETTRKYLSLLTDEERKTAQHLLQYPEDSIGRLMTTDYVSVKEDWSMNQVLDYIRRYGKDSETLNMVYVTDNQGYLIDDIRLREILLSPPEKKISELMDKNYVSLDARDDQEKAIEIFKQTNRIALPVTDFHGLLLGMITIDDVVDVMEEEDTEDIQKFGGIEALEESYNQISFGKLVRKRAGWLVLLFLGEMFTATAMGYFENEISKAVVLALFVPLIISSGGNSGSQASSLIIRAMALGEVGFKDWWRVMRREILSGLTLGAVLGAVGFGRIFMWQQLHFYNYGPNWLLIAITIFFSLIGVVMWGTFAGSMLPMVLKRLRFDPAASSAPFVATLVDVTGLVIYFSIAFIVLRGTLL